MASPLNARERYNTAADRIDEGGEPIVVKFIERGANALEFGSESEVEDNKRREKVESEFIQGTVAETTQWNNSKYYKQNQGNKYVTGKLAGNAVQAGLRAPFSNNIGPGNDVKEALTVPDVIGKKHDKTYHSKVTSKEVKAADKQATSEFGNVIAENLKPLNNPVELLQAGIGAAGLLVKQAAEHLAGRIIYPSVSGKRCRQLNMCIKIRKEVSKIRINLLLIMKVIKIE